MATQPTCPYSNPPPNSIAERVRQDILGTLVFVTVANGWRSTLDVHARQQRGDPSPTHGLTIVYQDDPQLAEGQDQQSHAWEEIFAIKFYVVLSETDGTTDVDTLVNNMRGDIESALCQRTTAQRSGLAQNTEPAGCLFFEAEHGEFAGGVVLVKVTYAHGFGDPFTSSYQ